MSHVREELLMQGQRRGAAFLAANGLTMPAIALADPARWLFGRTCAYYRNQPAPTITLCLARTAMPGTAGRSWSWPGYVVDRTPFGVVLHEIGHHIDVLLSDQTDGRYFGDFSAKLRAATGEPPITSYAPNDAEWFAEICRLYIGNPDLLAAMRPKTFAALRARLEPVEPRTWREVLASAPERTRAAAARKALS